MSRGHPTVLIVDDERLNRTVLAELLRAEYTVLIAKDGPSALEQARRHANEILLILLDVSMPGMNGYEVLSTLKADKQTADIMVVFITAQSSAADEELGLKLGAVDYVHKPIQAAIVSARVRNLVNLAHKSRALQRLVQLAGLGEGIVLIEPNEGIVWANEKALALHGVLTLADLGGTPAEYTKRFVLRYTDNQIVSDNEYPLARLLAGEAFDSVTVEVTKAAPDLNDAWRCVHEVRGQVLADSQGHSKSYALVILDVTERFTAEQRFERTFNADPAPAIICRLSDLKYIKVNQGFLEMTELTRENVIGRSIYAIDVLESAPDREDAIANLREGRSIARTEATLRLPGGGSHSVIVGGQPIDIADEACMLFTFMDIEPRRKAEDSLRQSEDRFARSFRLTPVPTMLVTRKDLRVLDVNDAFVSVLGYKEEEATGRSGIDLPIWVSASTPYRLERELEKNGGFRNIEFQLRTNRDELLACLLSGERMQIHDEECALIVIQDVTERRRSEVELMAAIETVMQDTSWFSRTVIEKLANLRNPGGPRSQIGKLADLTQRELEVLGLMCRGLSDVEIVKALGVTRNTVRNHIARIYGKADVHSRTKAVIWARERGFTGTEGKSSPR